MPASLLGPALKIYSKLLDSLREIFIDAVTFGNEFFEIRGMEYSVLSFSTNATPEEKEEKIDYLFGLIMKIKDKG